MKRILLPGHIENIVVMEGLEVGGIVLDPFSYTDMIQELRDCKQDAAAAIVVIRHSLKSLKINGKDIKLIFDKKKNLDNASISKIPGNCCANMSQKLMAVNTLTEDEKKN